MGESSNVSIVSRFIEAHRLVAGIALCSTALATLACVRPASPPVERRPNGDAGYRTVAVVNQVFLTSKSGGQGFDDYSARAVSDAGRVNDEVERQLASRNAEAGESAAPLFLYVHYFDSHWPYDSRTAEDRAALPVALTTADFAPPLPG